MDQERKAAYIAAVINFITGIIFGIILFYGQLKSGNDEIRVVYEYEKTVSLADFLRLSWMNVIWLISVFFARCIAPSGFFHPVVCVRGIVSSFSMLYILALFGFREAVSSILPQCVSILPLLLNFSVETAQKHKKNAQNGYEVCLLKRREIAAIFILSMLAGAVEVLFFRIFCKNLF